MRLGEVLSNLVNFLNPVRIVLGGSMSQMGSLLAGVRSELYERCLPMCTEDLVIGRRLLDVGCEALMPWGAPIGTGKGVVNPYGLRVLRERLPDVPLIVDAGLGVPSHACQVMEWGFDGVLLNTAVSQATHPEIMARAFAQGVEAGRAAYLAGPMDARETAHASTPVVGMPFWHQDGGGA
jgi:thiazole synthase